MYPFSVVTGVVFLATFATAKDIWIQVGGNKTGDATAIFQPQRVVAKLGDTVWFNFTQGNHTATQSTFSAPCTRAHDSNVTINGFDSMFRDAGNGTAVTTLSVPMLPQNVNQTMWFFDWNTCAQGGVGVINNDEDSDETLEGFVRNARRLNGTESTSTTSHRSTGSASAAATSQSASNDARHLVGTTATVLFPVLVVSLFV